MIWYSALGFIVGESHCEEQFYKSLVFTHRFNSDSFVPSSIFGAIPYQGNPANFVEGRVRYYRICSFLSQALATKL